MNLSDSAIPAGTSALSLAMEAHRAGRLADADAHYAAVLRQFPDHVQALRLRGILARDCGELERSRKLLRRAVELAPGDPEPAAELGLSYMAGGYLDLAEASFRRALDADPDCVRACANLGALLQYRGRLDAAVDCHRRVLELEPGDLEVRCNLAYTLLEAGKRTEALAECDRALSLSPGHPLLLAARGAVLCGLERFAEAVPELERALARNPRDDMALINLAFAHAELGAPDKAVSVLERALATNPDNARACADLVSLLVGAGEAGRAASVGETFLARHPAERLVLGATAYAFRDAGRDADADRLLTDERLIRCRDIRVPRGYADLESFNAALCQAVLADPSLVENPLSKSTRGGLQTGELALDSGAAFQAFEALIRREVDAAAAGWARAGLGDHPLMAGAGQRYTLRAWGTVLPTGGHQVPHMHPLAWLSGVYYAAVPDDMSGTGAHAGWIEFGQPPARIRTRRPPPCRLLEPRPGRLLLFPSWLFHRTLPFAAVGPRVSIAFDVMPVRG